MSLVVSRDSESTLGDLKNRGKTLGGGGVGNCTSIHLRDGVDSFLENVP